MSWSRFQREWFACHALCHDGGLLTALIHGKLLILFELIDDLRELLVGHLAQVAIDRRLNRHELLIAGLGKVVLRAK